MNGAFPMFRPLILILLVTALLCAPRLAAQEQETVEAVTPPSSSQVTLESLAALHRSITAKREVGRELEQKISMAPDDHTREELTADLEKLKNEVDELESNFADFALTVDVSLFEEPSEEAFNLQGELEKLVQPILAELKNATATSREIDALRTELQDLEKRESISSNAVANLEQLLAAGPDAAILDQLNELRETWVSRRDDFANRSEAVSLQLQNRLASRKSILQSSRNAAQNFFRTRGLNLVMGVGAFLFVFFGLRGLFALYRKIRRRGKDRSFLSRLFLFLYELFTILAALSAMLLVFNLMGDWFLLGIGILFLLGVGWASINTIPQHVERIKLMLNIGPVKEQERMLFDGVPWRVDSLGFSARLVNPELEGGEQVLPVHALVGHHSRRPGEHEEWFPCRAGDWVELDDGRFGRVSYQTPSVVQLVELGGSQAIYQTESFLGLNPKNLSTGFRIESTFGIDYKHQPESTTSIPGTMKARLQKELPELCGEKEIRNLDVRFTAAAASSLDYRVVVDLAGSAADKALRIRDAIARILVDACNENNWEIPFQQVTIHQALG